MRHLLILFLALTFMIPASALADNDKDLFIAAGDNDIAAVMTFIDEGADVNAMYSDVRMTALMLAALADCADAVRLLLENGADVNLGDLTGFTALTYASESGGIETIRLLLDHGADVNAMSKFGWNALIWATEFGHEEAVRLLIDYGAEMDAIGFEGRTALAEAVLSYKNGIARLLIEHGAEFEPWQIPLVRE